MKPLNEKAAELVRQMASKADELDVRVVQISGGAMVIDSGVRSPGSLEAGRLYAEICMSGLGKVSFVHYHEDGLSMPGLCVAVIRPSLACMASQYAGWQVSSGSYFAMASGPGRILRGREDLIREIGYSEKSDVAVLTLESEKLPPEEVVESLSKECGVSPSSLLMVVARTNSITASTQVVARVVETGMHKMHQCGFDIGTVKSGWGTAPLAPVGKNSLEAMGWTNDSVLYGGDVWYAVETDDALIEAVIEKLPSSASSDYGAPFAELFRKYEGDFYKIDPLLFSPARVTINNISTGRVFRAGAPSTQVLRKEWGL